MKIIIFILAMLVASILNLLIVRFLVNRILKKRIIPRLEELGLEFVRAEGGRFFKIDDDFAAAFPVDHSNNRMQAIIYRRIFYKDKSKKEKKIIVKIDWEISRGTKVDFSEEIFYTPDLQKTKV